MSWPKDEPVHHCSTDMSTTTRADVRLAAGAAVGITAGGVGGTEMP